jgi:hypothetical protein
LVVTVLFTWLVNERGLKQEIQREQGMGGERMEPFKWEEMGDVMI